MPAESPSYGVHSTSLWWGGGRENPHSPGGQPNPTLCGKSQRRTKLRGENASAEELRFPRVRSQVPQWGSVSDSERGELMHCHAATPTGKNSVGMKE